MKKNSRHLCLVLFVLMLSLCAMVSDRMGHPAPDIVESVLAESLVVLIFSGGLASVASVQKDGSIHSGKT